jgi:LysR family transcriptional regulator, transcriptional activator for dmlA
MQELHGLWHFVQAARAGSLTHAAQRLGLSTAALSKSVARLEQLTGTRLFVRTTRNLQLTSEGATLLGRVGDAFAAIEDSLERLREERSKPSGVVRISTVTAYGKHCLLPILPEFLERYPTVDVLISFHDGGRGLTRESYDIRINWGEEREQDKVSQTMCRMPLIPVASPAYLAKRGVPKHPEDLANHDCINVVLPNGSHARWTFLSSSGGRRGRRSMTILPKGRLTVRDELEAVCDAAVADLGVTVISSENVLGALREGSLVRVLPEYEVQGNNELGTTIIMQYSRKDVLSSNVRALVDFVLEKLKGRNPLELVTGAGGPTSASAARRRG